MFIDRAAEMPEAGAGLCEKDRPEGRDVPDPCTSLSRPQGGPSVRFRQRLGKAGSVIG
ncbi:hypothetical protein Sa4125_11370 [Aureimonas sp. SA4125]|nr:hypothetical protein Sa4125_11370 [Aureimonas sp. SA4125]